MRLYVSTVILTLAWFCVINATASLLAWLAADAVSCRVAGRSGYAGAEWLFALRMMPLALALFVAFGVYLPVHWVSESREGTEHFGGLLTGAALLGAALIAGSAVRVVLMLRACRRLQAGWHVDAGTPDRIVDEAAMMGMSLAGVVRTTIVVGRPVRDALTRDELDVAVAHEIAHRRSWDNLKRFVMYAAPDFFRCTAASRRLVRRWSAEVECLADARAVGGDATRAAHLASALVKVARLAGAASRTPTTPLWSTFHQPALLELRVRRLVAGVAIPADASPLATIGLLAAMTAATFLIALTSLPRAIYELSEAVVRLLP